MIKTMIPTNLSENERIRWIYNHLYENERHRAGVLYQSPDPLNEGTYTNALRDCMIAAGCWPGHQSTLFMEDGAAEYDDILAAQHLMGG